MSPHEAAGRAVPPPPPPPPPPPQPTAATASTPMTRASRNQSPLFLTYNPPRLIGGMDGGAGASALGTRSIERTASICKENRRLGGGDAEGGTRTHTGLPPPDFESGASASSATSARVFARVAALRVMRHCGAVAKRLAMLTGGGDCPGLNAVIRAVGRRSLDRGWEIYGVREGWRGLVESRVDPLGERAISGILPRGGTILGTSRTNPYKIEGGVDRVLGNFGSAALDALVAIGGEDTLGVATRLHAEHAFPVVGV